MGAGMTYTPESMAHWNIGQTVRHLLNQGIEPDVIRDALEKQRAVLVERMTRPGNTIHDT